MALEFEKKMLSKVVKKVPTIKQGGESILPYKLNKAGSALFLGAATVASIAPAAIEGHNKVKMGRISYGGGPDRMTNNFSSGAREAMMKLSKGNYEAFSEMAKDVVNSPGASHVIDTMGVTPDMIASMYHMGG